MHGLFSRIFFAWNRLWRHLKLSDHFAFMCAQISPSTRDLSHECLVFSTRKPQDLAQDLYRCARNSHYSRAFRNNVEAYNFIQKAVRGEAQPEIVKYFDCYGKLECEVWFRDEGSSYVIVNMKFQEQFDISQHENSQPHLQVSTLQAATLRQYNGRVRGNYTGHYRNIFNKYTLEDKGITFMSVARSADLDNMIGCLDFMKRRSKTCSFQRLRICWYCREGDMV
jgi:hypothetical protein